MALGPFDAGGPLSLTVTGAQSRVEVGNVLVGEVWLCAGQSNMAMATRDVLTSSELEARAKPGSIRLLHIPLRRTSGSRVSAGRWRWEAASADAVGKFPASCYLFGQKLQQHLGVPVGLIAAAVGGSSAETWMSPNAFGDARVDRSANLLNRALDAMEHRHQIEHPTGKTDGSFDRLPSYRPSELFETMIRPIAGYAMRGLAWYQGEANQGRGEFYKPVMEALIGDLRQAWNSPSMPFLFVQLPGFGVAKSAMVPGGWVNVRQAQAEVQRSTDRVGMVVTLDCGDEDIHPKIKLPVAERLVRAARAVAYGEKVRYSGPVYRGYSRRGNTIELEFSSFDVPLVAKGGGLAGFFIAGKDRRWVEAEAVISGNRVLLRHKEVPEPVAVRYAWSQAPVATLFDSDGLPAGPFRTDDW